MPLCRCELFSGRPPWAGLTDVDIKRRVCGELADEPSRPPLPPDLPPALAELITRGWSLSPTARPRIHEYLCALQNILDDARSGVVDKALWGRRGGDRSGFVDKARATRISDLVKVACDPSAELALVLDICHRLATAAEEAAVTGKLMFVRELYCFGWHSLSWHHVAHDPLAGPRTCS
jgi:hypothetical protein